MAKLKITFIIIGCILLAAALTAGLYLVTVRVNSSKVNLVTPSNNGTPKPVTTAPQEADVTLSNGVKLHYAVYGTHGEPVLLIHGNGGSHKSLEDLATYLANDYIVYAPDSRCQGQSAQTDKVSYALMAEDMKLFLEAMDISSPYVVGHSDGGIIAIQMAIAYPDLMRAFVAYGANSEPSGLKHYFTAPIVVRYKSKPKELDRIMIEEPDFTKDKLARIKSPALIAAGEFDIVKLEDSKYLAENITGAELQIVKWKNHSFIRDGEYSYTMVKAFFDKH